MVRGDGVVLLIGSGRRSYREYLFKGLSESASLWLIDQQMATWQAPYIVGSSAVSLADPARMVPDEAGLLEAATEIARVRPVVGVCTYDEAFVIAAARVAERLGLPGLTVAGAQRCRDKYMTRLALTNAGLPQPGYALVHTLSQAEKGAQNLGFPVVVKPRGMGASAGVVMVSDVEQMTEAFAVAGRASHAGPPAFDEGLLVEEMVQGPEISVDGAVMAGEYSPFCLARKRLGTPPTSRRSGTSSTPPTHCWAMPGCATFWQRHIAPSAWLTA